METKDIYINTNQIEYTNISYKGKTISVDEINTVVSKIFNKYHDEKCGKEKAWSLLCDGESWLRYTIKDCNSLFDITKFFKINPDNLQLECLAIINNNLVYEYVEIEINMISGLTFNHYIYDPFEFDYFIEKALSSNKLFKLNPYKNEVEN